MSKYEKLEQLNDVNFKRLIGVKKETFDAMLFEYNKFREQTVKDFGVGGAKQKLIPEDKILLMLEYFREYRTLAHIGFDYGVSEATASRVVKEVESILIKSKRFSLPSKRALYGDDIDLNFVVIDVTEIEIQRPKKSKKSSIQEKRKNIQ
jgi:hypothetical protein